MTDIFPQLRQWVAEGQPFALATVIKTWGSSPRPIGSVLAVTENMDMAGSVSGGCIEGQVAKAALEALKDNKVQKLKFGVSDEDAWSVGLSCGGAVHVLVEPCPAFAEAESERQVWEALERRLQANESSVLISAASGEKPGHLLVLPEQSAAIGDDQDAPLLEGGLQAYRERKNQMLELDKGEYFARVFPRKSQLFVIGAAHITSDLVRLGNFFGFETIVVDPRGIFAEKTQFPEAPAHLIVDWPAEVLPGYRLDAYSYAVMLSHDPKIDDQALHLLLESEVGYIGALGSRRTHEKRVKRLREAGFSDDQIDRIHAPVGIDINAKRPREIALSIMAEIIQVQNAHL